MANEKAELARRTSRRDGRNSSGTQVTYGVYCDRIDPCIFGATGKTVLLPCQDRDTSLASGPACQG